MISRLGPLLLLALLLGGVSSHAGAQSAIPFVDVYLDNLGQPLHLAPVDADAFQRRLNQPPELEPRPLIGGVAIGVDTPYWDAALRESPDDPQVGIGGFYYQDGGFVRLDRGGRAAWIVLDLRQRAILDRYIRLGSQDAIGASPGVLQVIAAAAADGETIGVQLGNRTLTDDEVEAFWPLVEGLAPLDLPPGDGEVPRDGPAAVWVTFSLPEGRDVQLRYTYGAGTLVDSLGQEVYAVPKDWLQPILGDYGPETLDQLSSSIEQEKPAGSWVWWPVILGGGAALLALAVWLSRRLASADAT